MATRERLRVLELERRREAIERDLEVLDRDLEVLRVVLARALERDLALHVEVFLAERERDLAELQAMTQRDLDALADEPRDLKPLSGRQEITHRDLDGLDCLAGLRDLRLAERAPGIWLGVLERAFEEELDSVMLPLPASLTEVLLAGNDLLPDDVAFLTISWLGLHANTNVCIITDSCCIHIYAYTV